MAEKLASALERGWHFRRAGHSTLRRIMESGAKGALIKISGKLTSQRHRTQKFKAGHIKYCGEPKNDFVRVGFATAKVKKGVIGVTVWITDPKANFPDEIGIQAPVKVEEVAPEAEVEAQEAVAEEAARILTREKEEKPVVATSRVEKALKKVKKVAKDLGEDVEVDVAEDVELPEEPEQDKDAAESEAPESGEPSEDEPASKEGASKAKDEKAEE